MEPTFRRTATEHRDAVISLLSRPPAATHTEVLPLAQALGRVLAADLAAPCSLPPFDNSQMDGYAVRSEDLAAGRPLPVAAAIPAGAAAPELAPGTAAPIMTGAMLPAGADAVVPIEAAVPPRFPAFVGGRHAHDADASVTLPDTVPAGQFVRRAGSDIAAGSRALPAGTRLGPAQLGLAAALGLAELAVIARPRALILSTGDEVRAPGTELAPGQIHDANTTMLAALLTEAGWEAHPAGISADTVEEFDAALARAIAPVRAAAGNAAPGDTALGTAAPGPGVGGNGQYDLILTSGGISKGAFEVVRQALAGRGVGFGTVAMQPGGPQGAGLLVVPGGPPVPFLAFPGNPVSSVVSFEMFLRPALSARTGLAPRRTVQARLAESILGSPEGKLQLRRALLAEHDDGTATVVPVGGPASHLVRSLAASNALILVPEGVTAVAAGDTVPVLLTGETVMATGETVLPTRETANWNHTKGTA